MPVKPIHRGMAGFKRIHFHVILYEAYYHSEEVWPAFGLTQKGNTDVSETADYIVFSIMNKVRPNTISSHLLILVHKYVNSTHQTSWMHQTVTQNIPLHCRASRVRISHFKSWILLRI